jgi:GxxExxY protein
MNYKDAKTEPGKELDDLAHRIIGAAIEVHRELGPGYLESVYEEALAVEFGLAGVAFERQKLFGLSYKKLQVGEGRVDFLLDRRMVLEIKAVEAILPIHKAQVISYLKATKCRLGLLINFNEKVLKNGIQRIIWTDA